MKKLTLLLTLLIPVFTFSQIINIPDDYPTIQEGIDAANNGDTVLVDTGTYVENINFNGKNITVASHYLTTLDTSYISNTIIDGGEPDIDDSGSVVTFNSGEDSTAVLCGFTIQNGSGFEMGEDTYYHMGGGIYCNGANPTFKNLIITNNHAEDNGGGMYIILSQSTLQNVVIKNNSSQFGGGVSLGYGANIIFDSISLCSIYFNQAAIGNDIYSQYPVEVFLDTFSVTTPTGFYATPVQNFNFNILNGLTELIDEDLYVSPEGDNNNDGLSEETAFKTIHYAFSKIRADSLHRNIVHLLSGTYSIDSEEIFPIYIPDYTYLKGEDKNTVILDGENASYKSIVYFKLNEFVQISDLTLINGSGFDANNGGGIYSSQANFILKDLIITECFAFEGSAIFLRDNSDAKLIRVGLIDNGGGWGGVLTSWGSNVYMEDCVIANNNDPYALDFAQSNATLINTLINDNEGVGITSTTSDLRLTNVTITKNTSNGGSGAIRSGNSTLNLENTILWNNYSAEISFYEDYGSDTLFISYSNIEGGEQGIITNDSTTIFWLEGNINQDPLYVSSGNHPYQINDYSPCIDAGTPDTTGLNLPEYDLAGEIRTFNDRVDMGAYEWNTFVGIEESSMPEQDNFQVKTYPNPFTSELILEYTLKRPETTIITFYNQFGKQVDVIEESLKKGFIKAVWTPENLSDGIYYFRLESGEQMGSGKVVLVK